MFLRAATRVDLREQRFDHRPLLVAAEAGIEYDSADPTFLPSMSVPHDAEAAKKLLRLIEGLEDSDEVQNVYVNFDVSDEVMTEVG